ncbi:hypothetical protein P175DRAFT_0526074 [Aspergillus ochraceoroseus IBT 24754]|uniref:Uncharacterized protein n=1 Tax=Aspergillus ochraceoroseus IBT 24754 TaxID=1392256 RepID=A0A2T5LPV7_9EURO|nr:uncharacterized protein P175DRAFT_0526074 [Aspergillus ochraceoroseus IBT 24754]PTU18319.1 hypothetical protein P175DRAFT_0526074 [Aspergillus ochraceoroseus IBT 24754]
MVSNRASNISLLRLPRSSLPFPSHLLPLTLAVPSGEYWFSTPWIRWKRFFFFLRVRFGRMLQMEDAVSFCALLVSCFAASARIRTVAFQITLD